MTFDEAMTYIRRVQTRGSVYGLERMGVLLDELDCPQKDLRFIHVAGTNGKGSVCAFIDSILREAGFRTGRFISPTLFDYRERIQINGRYIEKQAVARYVEQLKAAADRMTDRGLEAPTLFEMETAMGFMYFRDESCDYVVLETGMGGRKDPTNVCRPVLTLITSIGLDHMQYLGSSLSQIAYEKAGIIKPGVPVISGTVNPAARDVIRKIAKEKKAPLVFVGEGEPFYEYAYDFVNNQTVLHTRERQEWLLHALGRRQTINACVVYQAAKRLKLPEAAVRKGLETVVLPGRFEVVRLGENTFILDGAHNPQAVELLMKFWQKTPFTHDTALLCGFMKDKDYKKMLSLLCPHFSRIILTVPPSVRGAGEPDLLAALPKQAKVLFEPNWKKALALARKSPRILCTGSFYLVGAVRGKLPVPDHG